MRWVGLVAALLGCGAEVVIQADGDGGSASSSHAVGGAPGGGSSIEVGGGAPDACLTGLGVYACAVVPPPAPDTIATFSGTVFEIYDGAAPPACYGGGTTVPGHTPPPPTVTNVRLVLDVGEHVDVAIRTPGFGKGSVVAGELVTLQVSHVLAAPNGYSIGRIALWSGDALVGLVAQNEASPLTIGEGVEVCDGGGPCGAGRRAMTVAFEGADADIPPGDTAPVGSLIVTNDVFYHLYDPSVGCSFAEGTTLFRVGAARPAPD